VSSFGAQLKQERERQGVSLEDISLTTKIATRMLRALEDEHFDQLPGGIFNKGFIRAYARCLHMDEDQAVADYLVATGAGPLAAKSEDDDQTPILEPPSREGEPATTGLPWGAFAVVLLIVALGFAAWGFYYRESESAQQDSTPPAANSATANPHSASPPAATEPSPPEPKPAESADSSPTASKPPEKPTEQPPAKTPESESTPTQAATNPPLTSTTPAPTSATTPPQPAVPTSGTLLLVVKAREDSWLSISVDGEIVTRALLAAPAQRTVRAQNEIVVRVGNAGALDFEFNGQKLPTQGDYGEAKTLIFTPRGLQPSTPKPQPPTQSP
jgi:cytoskeleton protein RodZ